MAAIRTLLQGTASPADLSGVAPGLFLLRRPDEWAAHWTLLNGGLHPEPALPAVDWTWEAVLVLILGLRPTTGYAVTIRDVVARLRYLEAHVTESRHDGPAGQMVTVPVHAVAVPKAAIRTELLLIQRVVTLAG